MIKNVRIKAKDTMSWFGGICWVPIACLKNEKTTMSLKKLVITKRREGAKTKRVKTIRTLSELTKSLGSLGADIDISMLGTLTGSAPKEATVKKSRIATTLKMAISPQSKLGR
jgi:hypothetical protein